MRARLVVNVDVHVILIVAGYTRVITVTSRHTRGGHSIAIGRFGSA